MKILLVNPPRENEIIGNNPSIIEENRGFNPPLGLLYIAGYLEKHTNHNITIIDAQVEEMDYFDLEKMIRSINPDVMGLTTMTMTLIDVINTINIVRRINKNIKIVLGGPHVHLFPYETMMLGNIDYLVAGEGEVTFKLLLDHIDDKSKLREIPGLVFQDNGKLINTGARQLIRNLDDIPFPARHLVPYRKYNSLLTKGNVVTTIFTSRGCPYKCSFCDRPHLGKRFRSRSAKNVVDEIEECTKMGIYDFLFYDDTFAVIKKRVIDICNEIVKRKLDISWDIRTRVDTVDEEMLKKLKSAGCKAIHYGIEAGSERILKVLQKGITINQAKQIFCLTKKYNMKVLAYFMIGSPSETMDEIQETFRVIKCLNPDYLHLTILTPFPGTKVYYDGLKKGIIKKDHWQEFAENPTSDFVSPHWDEYFSREELNKFLIEGYKSFYLRPSYLLRSIFYLRSFGEFKKKAVAGLKVLAMK